MLSKSIKSKLPSLLQTEKSLETARALPIGKTGGRHFELIIEGKRYRFAMHAMLKHVEKLIKNDKSMTSANVGNLKGIASKLTDMDETSYLFLQNSKRIQVIFTRLRQFFGNLFHRRFDRNKLKAWMQAKLPSVLPPKETPKFMPKEPFKSIPEEKNKSIPKEKTKSIPKSKVDPIPSKAFNPAPIDSLEKQEARTALKAQLLHFYVGQDARLQDLKAALEKSPEKKETIRREIVKIENSQIERILWTTDKYGHIFKSDMEFSKLAVLLGKTVAETRVILLGQTYAKVFKNHLTEMIALLNSLDSKEWDQSELVALKLLDNPNKGIDINALHGLMRKAYAINPTEMENLKQKLDQVVSQELQLKPAELNEWLQDLIDEQEFDEKLTLLGQEVVTHPHSDFKNSSIKIFEKYKVPNFQIGNEMWRHFELGHPASYTTADSQWKLFINPRSTEFLPTLDRVLNVLSKNGISVSGKIIGSDQVKRHSECSVLEDPCEPKFVLYFRGIDVAEDFKKAIEILEDEFKDAELIAAPQGQRKRSDGKVVLQRGPSFTKNRNNLLFYTQGGFTESGRCHIVSACNHSVHSNLTDELTKEFEGENFYLHKGFTDPLASLTVSTISLDSFLDELEGRIGALNRPMQLVKLQNMVTRLRQEKPLSKETAARVGRLEKAIEQATKNLSLKRQQTMIQMLDYNSGMGDVHAAFSKAFLKKVSTAEADLDCNKGRIQAQLEYVAAQAQTKVELIDQYLAAALKGRMPSNEEFHKLMDAIPLTLRDLFFASLGDEVKRSVLEKIKASADQKLTAFFKNKPATVKNFKEKEFDTIFLRYRNNQIGLFNVFFYRFFAYDEGVIVRARFGLFAQDLPPPFLEEKIKLTFSDLNVSSQLLIKNLQVFKAKLESVRDRQLKRLEALKQGAAVSLPVFFHTAPLEVAASIASTGVEVTPAAKGTGTYVSTEPELTYGAVSFGFPESLGFISDAVFFADYRGHTAIGGKQAVWSAFKEMLEVQPGTLQVRRQFLDSLQEVIRERVQQAHFLTFEQQIDLEMTLLQRLNAQLVFRMPSPGTLQIGYREHKTISLIQDDKAFEVWIERHLTPSLNCYSKLVPFAFKDDFLKELSTAFKASFKHALPLLTEGFSIENWNKGKIKPTITGIDDDLKDYYQKVFGVVEGYRPGKTFATMADIKKTLTEAGLDTEQIEFVPSFEQYLERDLREPFQEVPAAWKNDENL